MHLCKGSGRFIQFLQRCFAPRVTLARQLSWSPHSSLPGIVAPLFHDISAFISTPLKSNGLFLRLGAFLNDPIAGVLGVRPAGFWSYNLPKKFAFYTDAEILQNAGSRVIRQLLQRRELNTSGHTVAAKLQATYMLPWS